MLRGIVDLDRFRRQAPIKLAVHLQSLNIQIRFSHKISCPVLAFRYYHESVAGPIVVPLWVGIRIRAGKPVPVKAISCIFEWPEYILVSDNPGSFPDWLQGIDASVALRPDRFESHQAK